jgi:hypothetical protein
MPMVSSFDCFKCNMLKKNFRDILLHIKLASKHCNDVILSDAKNLAFSCYYEILHSVQDDNYIYLPG